MCIIRVFTLMWCQTLFMIKIMATVTSKTDYRIISYIFTFFALLLMYNMFILLNLVATFPLRHKLNRPNFDIKYRWRVKC